MNQERIGKFIMKCRKEKKITQSDLANKLGVSDRAISNWENGRNMPDLSLFRPLCEELNISINDLLSGERVNPEKYQETFEENMVNTIDYTNKKMTQNKKIVALILIGFGLFIVFSAMTVFPSESSWGCIYSLFGTLLSIIGINFIFRKINLFIRVVFNLVLLCCSFMLLFIIDFIGVKNIHQAPRFSLVKVSGAHVIYYDTPFYDVVRCMENKNEYRVIKNQKYDQDNIDVFCK